MTRSTRIKSVIIDAEIVANNPAGAPDFFSLHTRSVPKRNPDSAASRVRLVLCCGDIHTVGGNR